MLGSVTSKLEESGLNPLRQHRFEVRVPGTRQKCHHLRHKTILDSYDDFNTYLVVG